MSAIDAFDHGCDSYGFDIQGRCAGCGRDFYDQVSAASDASEAVMAEEWERMMQVPEYAALANGGCATFVIRRKPVSKVRCKVKCTATGQRDNGHDKENPILHTAEFAAVYDSNPESENGQFFKWTPSLRLETGIIRGQHFEAGKEYYLDFTPVEA